MIDTEFKPEDTKDVTDTWPNPNTDNLPEAPASANIKLWIEGYGVQVTIRGKEVNDILGKILQVIEHAKKANWKSRWEDQPVAMQTGFSTPGQAPTKGNCPIHGLPFVFKQGIKRTGGSYAFWACPGKDPNGNYCNQKPTV